MNLFNQMSERVSEKFDNAKLEGTGRLAPRSGYFFIRTIIYREFHKFDQVPIGIVNWKASKEGFFLDGLEFEVALLNLPIDPKLNKVAALEHLINKTIFVYDLGIGPRLNNGKETQGVFFDFDIINEAPSFKNANDVKFLALFGEFKTISEACEDFAKNAPYDVALAEEDEANGYGDFCYDEGGEWFDEGYCVGFNELY
jgi:hypothetical protein